MTMFGSDVTTLSEPQGAGAKVVEPATANPLAGIGQLGESLFNAYKSLSKDSDPVAEYTRKAIKLDQLNAEGSIIPGKYRAEQEKLYREYGSKHPELIDKLQKARGGVAEGTGLGTADAEAAAQRNEHFQLRAQASNMGWDLRPDMTPQQVDTILSAVKRANGYNLEIKALREREEEERKRAAEGRAVVEFNQGQSDRRIKERVVKGLAELGTANIEALGAQLQAISAGSEDLETKQAKMLTAYNRLASQISLTGTVNGTVLPIADKFGALAKDVYELFSKQIDPKTRAENFTNLFNQKMAEAKLMAIGSPQVLANAASVALFQNVPENLLSASLVTNEVIYRVMSGVSASPEDIRAAGVKEATSVLADQLDNAAKATPAQKKEQEAVLNGVNNLLRSLHTTDYATDGNLDAKDIKPFVDLISKPAFKELVKQGKIDQKDLSKAYEVIKVAYAQPVISKMQEMFDKEGFEGKRVRENVKIIETPAGIRFEAKSPDYRISNLTWAGSTNRELKSAEKALNQLLIMSANTSNSTPQEVWLQTRHEIFPSMYSAPETKKAPASGSKSMKTEANMKEAIAGTDTGAGMTQDVIKELKSDLDNGRLSPAQIKELEQLLKKIKGQ